MKTLIFFFAVAVFAVDARRIPKSPLREVVREDLSDLFTELAGVMDTNGAATNLYALLEAGDDNVCSFLKMLTTNEDFAELVATIRADENYAEVVAWLENEDGAAVDLEVIREAIRRLLAADTSACSPDPLPRPNFRTLIDALFKESLVTDVITFVQDKYESGDAAMMYLRDAMEGTSNAFYLLIVFVEDVAHEGVCSMIQDGVTDPAALWNGLSNILQLGWDLPLNTDCTSGDGRRDEMTLAEIVRELLAFVKIDEIANNIETMLENDGDQNLCWLWRWMNGEAGDPAFQNLREKLKADENFQAIAAYLKEGGLNVELVTQILDAFLNNADANCGGVGDDIPQIREIWDEATADVAVPELGDILNKILEYAEQTAVQNLLAEIRCETPTPDCESNLYQLLITVADDATVDEITNELVCNQGFEDPITLLGLINIFLSLNWDIDAISLPLECQVR